MRFQEKNIENHRCISICTHWLQVLQQLHVALNISMFEISHFLNHLKIVDLIKA